MTDPIQALSRLRDFCRSNEPIPHDLREWLGQSIELFLKQDACDLDEAFGVARFRGGIPWWMTRSISERDTALRQLVKHHLSDLSLSAQARQVHRLSRRYEAVAWSRDQRLEFMPARYRGTEFEWLWLAFRSGGRMPVSERHLRTILRGAAMEEPQHHRDAEPLSAGGGNV
jgi:hypothetical protein